MNGISVSKNGMYLISEQSVFSVIENKRYDWYDVTIDKWIDILSENTKYSISKKLISNKELASYHRKITYQLMESISYELKSNLMLEYEVKFGSILLTENLILAENWFGDAWDWTKDKVGKVVSGAGDLVKWVGGKIADFGVAVWDRLKTYGYGAVKFGKDFISCVSGGGCSPLFEDWREILFSPEGIAIETILAATGIGDIVPVIAWGVMLAWDIYLWKSGDSKFSWLNLIMDVIGVVAGAAAKGLKVIFEGLFGPIAKTAGKGVVGIVEKGMENPQTASIFKKFAQSAKPYVSKLTSALSQVGKFLKDKLGITWVGKVINKVGDAIAEILNAIGFKSSATKAASMGITQKELTKQGVRQGVKAGVTMAGATYGIEKSAELYHNYKAGQTQKELSKAVDDDAIQSNVDANMDDLLKQL
jgi:hypothetical protein